VQRVGDIGRVGVRGEQHMPAAAVGRRLEPVEDQVRDAER
jgi:hypothetical protein